MVALPTEEVAALSQSYVEKENLDMTKAKPKLAAVARKAANRTSQQISEMFGKISQKTRPRALAETVLCFLSIFKLILEYSGKP
eukprot:IDg9255t1